MRGKNKSLVRKRYVVESIVQYGWDSILAAPAGRPGAGLGFVSENAVRSTDAVVPLRHPT